MNYENIQELNDAFTKGKMKEMPERVTVGGINYRLRNSNEVPFDKVLKSNTSDKDKPLVVYALEPKADNKERYKKVHTTTDDSEFQERIIFAWTAQRLNVRPVKVKFVSKNRVNIVIKEAQVADEKIIGHKTPIILRGFNGNNSVKAKVDTGAVMSSLDANFPQDNQWKPGDETVTFEFGDRRVTMPCTSQGVKSADGGTEYRPVVKFDVELPIEDPSITNKTLKGVQFNLNDRSGMPDKILLGQNFIKAGDFVVMNKGSEAKVIESDEINWNALQEEFAGLELPEADMQLSEAIDIVSSALKKI